MFAPAPLNKDFEPSLAMICLNASNELLYFTASPEVIIIRRRTVSMGYEASPAPIVIPHPSKKLAKKLPCYTQVQKVLCKSAIHKKTTHNEESLTTYL
jgi:hypothetical protein